MKIKRETPFRFSPYGILDNDNQEIYCRLRIRQLICLRRHNEIVFIQPADLTRPPLQILVVRYHKSLVHRLLVNLVIDAITEPNYFHLPGECNRQKYN